MGISSRKGASANMHSILHQSVDYSGNAGVDQLFAEVEQNSEPFVGQAENTSKVASCFFLRLCRLREISRPYPIIAAKVSNYSILGELTRDAGIGRVIRTTGRPTRPRGFATLALCTPQSRGQKSIWTTITDFAIVSRQTFLARRLWSICARSRPVAARPS